MIERKEYESDGVNLSVKVIGTGRPVVVLHGFGMNNSHWLPYIIPFTKEFQFFLPDLRGFGASCEFYDCYDDALARHADDLEALISAFELDAPHVMGYSLGGLTILQYLSMYGDDRLGKITLMDVCPKIHSCEEWAHPLFGHRNKERFSSWQSMYFEFKSIFSHSRHADIDYADLPGNYQKRINNVLGGFLSDAFKYRWAKGFIKSASRTSGILDFIFPMEYWHVFFDHSVSFLNNNYDFRGCLRDVSVPTTLISGELSEIFPYGGQLEMAAMIPRCLHLIQSNSGHMLMLDEPTLFYRNFSQSLLWEETPCLVPA